MSRFFPSTGVRRSDLLYILMCMYPFGYRLNIYPYDNLLFVVKICHFV